jgi:flagellar hook-associated protein 1
VGYSSKILNNSVSSLLAQQAAIATTSNNIANVNTQGYVRRSVQFETRSGGSAAGTLSVGNGVEISGVTREVDQFVDRALRQAVGEKAGYDIEEDFYSRVESLFALNENGITIGSALTEFKTALNDLAAQPASIELRTNVIERGEDLVNAIKLSYNTVAGLQTEADDRVVSDVDTVNTLATQIAKLNGEIRTRESTGNIAADERDQREVLLKKLAEKVQYSMVEENNGEVNVFIGKGFALVSGTTARLLQTTTSPSFASGTVPPSLSGQALHYIVYDYDTTGTNPQQIDLTQAIQGGTGSLGALLTLRGCNSVGDTSAFQANGTLVDIASRIEAITRQLLTSVNQTYLGGSDEDPATPIFDPSSGDLNGNTPSVYGLFDFTGSSDVDVNGLPDDLSAIAGIDNFSSILSFKPSDPREIAAAYDADAAAGSRNFPSGDNQNLLALISTINSTSLTFSAGPTFSITGSFDQAYNQALTFVGALKSAATSNAKVASSNVQAVEQRRDSISGVSLDEEFSALIKYQNAYQASARMIKMADELLAQIVQLI